MKPVLALKIRRGNAWCHLNSSCHRTCKEIQQLPLHNSYSYLLMLLWFRGLINTVGKNVTAKGDVLGDSCLAVLTRAELLGDLQ